ncbi:MAG TPA: hypothetical protein VEO56_10440 [Bacteroidota bacterium]|nr:hypothetical protein [Bacteroidota bacterium]
MNRGLDTNEVAHILGIADRVVLEYTRIVGHFHPKLIGTFTL